jgi:hypothetical protein
MQRSLGAKDEFLLAAITRDLRKRLCHGNEGWFGRGEGPVGPHAAATASCHRAAASVLKIRSVDREIRWRWRLKVL